MERMTALVRYPRRGLAKTVAIEIERAQAVATVATAVEMARLHGKGQLSRAALAEMALVNMTEAAYAYGADERARARLAAVADHAATSLAVALHESQMRI
jgi:hypothetical protein